MRTRNILTIGALVMVTTMYAQEGGKGGTFDPPAWSILNDSLAHELDLTNDQLKLVQRADEQYRENRKAGDKEALEKRDRDLKAALLPTQYERWKRIENERKKAAK